MKTNKIQSIGVDVGGTKILLQAFDKSMNVVVQEQVATETKKGQKGFVDQLMDLIDGHFDKGVKSMGVAVPGIVDHAKGVLVKAPHLPVKNLKFKALLEKRFKCPVTIDNDANAFLYAQYQRPRLQKYQHVIAVMPGTGLGGSSLVEGKIVYGKKGFAGELGHMVIRADSPLNTFEKNTSGSAVPKIARSLGIERKFTSFELDEKTPEAKQVKRHLVQHLGLGLANLNLIFNPDAFVLGGSVYLYHLKDSTQELQKIIAQHALDQSSPVIIDADQKHTVAMGAALMSQV